MSDHCNQAQVVKLVDTPASGAGDLTVVEVRVFSWAPIQKTEPSARLFLACDLARLPSPARLLIAGWGLQLQTARPSRQKRNPETPATRGNAPHRPSVARPDHPAPARCRPWRPPPRPHAEPRHESPRPAHAPHRHLAPDAPLPESRH